MNATQSDDFDTSDLAGFDEAYAKETRDLLGDRMRTSLVVGSLLYLGFSVLDWFLARDYWAQFLVIRLVVTTAAFGVLFGTRTDWGKRNILVISVCVLALGSCGLSLMTAMLEGFHSDYFYGNMLVLFLVGLFMPWRPGVTLTFCVLVTAGYLVINLWTHKIDVEALLPFLFLLGTGALTTMGSVAIERSRRRDLWLRMQFSAANAELQQLDEAKTRFFANVSHELRTPLMLILGPLESMISGTERSNPRALLESMNANAHRLLRQVNMILDFAKFEAGRQECVLDPGNVGDMLSELVRGAEPHAETQDIRLESFGLDELPNSAFDQEKIETAAANLLSNAMKFTPAGGRITVRAGLLDERIWFEVEDTGPGIAQAEQAKVFERFHQVIGSQTTKIQGTGLGLSLSRELVRLHGGEIRLRSASGIGSTFRVELPLKPQGTPGEALATAEIVGTAAGDAHDDQAFGGSASAHSAQLGPAMARKGRDIGRTEFADLVEPTLEQEETLAGASASAPLLLVVEDNSDMRAFIARSLSRRYRVETAKDGLDGIDQARRLRPDLIISDVMMPRLDGFGMLERLREDASLAAIPVIMLTARTGSDSLIHGLELGAVDYVTKPFRLSELEARIDAQLRHAHLQKELDEKESRAIAVGQMTGQIAHDLRSPLTALTTGISVLHKTSEKSGYSDEVKDDLVSLGKSVHRASTMVNDLVEYLRGQEVHLELKNTLIASFLTEIAEEVSAGLEASGIDLILEQDSDPNLCASLSSDHMRRVMVNLINNAQEAITQFADASGSRIWIQVRAEGDWVRIRVADNGPGVPEEIRDELFQPFTTAGKPKGTGLGMVIVANLVAAHGGEVQAEFHPPEGGAAFTLSLARDQSMWEALAVGLKK